MQKARSQPKNSFEKLMEHRPAQIVFGLVTLGAACLFATWAIDTGSLLDYAITLILIFLGVRELIRAARKKPASS